MYRRAAGAADAVAGDVYALRESLAVGITRDKRWLKAQELNARLTCAARSRTPSCARG